MVWLNALALCYGSRIPAFAPSWTKKSTMQPGALAAGTPADCLPKQSTDTTTKNNYCSAVLIASTIILFLLYVGDVLYA